MVSRRKLLVNLPVVLFAAVSQPKVNDYYPLPIPQFCIGQRVKVWYDLEDFPELVEAAGTVKGLCWQPEGWRIKVGWVYQVYFQPHPLLDTESWWEGIPEFDLEPL